LPKEEELHIIIIKKSEESERAFLKIQQQPGNAEVGIAIVDWNLVHSGHPALTSLMYYHH